MKGAAGILLLVLLFPASIFSQTGADCANAIPLTLDGVCRTYATSASTGNPVLCTSYASGTPVTYFSFTTNSTPDKVLLNITAPTSDPCEILMYSGSLCGSTISLSSMCFDDGEGLWAPGHSFTLAANTTYKIRIKTATSGNISICAQHYTPPNDDCAGAMSIGPDPTPDNNACHLAGPGVTATQLCGTTLENTAFYKYTVAMDGVSIININNVQCDNGAINNSTGMQVGFFTGNCSSLTPISCYSGSGSFITATTGILSAGTDVYVAIDGTAGANCRYDINVINALVLSADIKNFIAWKKASSNLLTWTSLRELRNDYFEIERSSNGRDFTPIGRVRGEIASYTDKQYSFEDFNPAQRSFYRLKQVDISGKIHYYNTILVIREKQELLNVSFQNPARDQLILSIHTTDISLVKLRIISMAGVVMKEQTVRCLPGQNRSNLEIANLSAGNYLLESSTGMIRVTRSFIKTNTP